ncbi:hypothetical protein IKQ26_07685 [bacterium]|nr:hypothetical protein [bacterium]
MYISPITAYSQCSFKGLLNRKPQQKPDPVIKAQGGKELKYEIKDEILFVKGKPYTGKVRLEYKEGNKENRAYEEGRVTSSDLNGDGRAKVYYAYEPLPDGKVKQYAFYEDDDGIKGPND